MPSEVITGFSLVCLVLIVGLVGYTVYHTRKYEQTMNRLRKEADERLRDITAAHEQRLAELSQAQGSVALPLEVARVRRLVEQNRAQQAATAESVRTQVESVLRQGIRGDISMGARVASDAIGTALNQQMEELLNQTLRGYNPSFVTTTTTTTLNTPEEAALLQGVTPEEAFRIMSLPSTEFQAALENLRAARTQPVAEPEPPTLWDRLNHEEP